MQMFKHNLNTECANWMTFSMSLLPYLYYYSFRISSFIFLVKSTCSSLSFIAANPVDTEAGESKQQQRNLRFCDWNWWKEGALIYCKATL